VGAGQAFAAWIPARFPILVMPDRDVRYTLSLIDHRSGQRLKIELMDLAFPCRRYRLRINGQWAKKLPEAAKTEVHPVR
jgi:hypothetical protein